MTIRYKFDWVGKIIGAQDGIQRQIIALVISADSGVAFKRTMRTATGTTPRSLFTALIRTHHITSRKKLQRVKKEASRRALPFVLIRFGGRPGIMYAEGAEDNVAGWVTFVRGLRYKEFQLLRKPAAIEVLAPDSTGRCAFVEVESVTEFGHHMEQRGLAGWWKSAMGYSSTLN